MKTRSRINVKLSPILTIVSINDIRVYPCLPAGRCSLSVPIRVLNEKERDVGQDEREDDDGDHHRDERAIAEPVHANFVTIYESSTK